MQRSAGEGALSSRGFAEKGLSKEWGCAGKQWGSAGKQREEWGRAENVLQNRYIKV